jgi:hypothetical protein
MITKYVKYIKEAITNELIRIEDFPKNIQKILVDEYGSYFYYNFDWNTEQDKHGVNFNKWCNDHANKEFLKNLDYLIILTGQDLTKIKRREFAQKKLEDFEDLIKDAIDKNLFKLTLKKYEYNLIMYGYDYNGKELQQELAKVKDIFYENGDIDFSKIEEITINLGGINLPNFERFVKKNPEYQGIFDEWKKLFDADIDATLTELNAFRDSTPFDKIKELNIFLKSIRKKL